MAGPVWDQLVGQEQLGQVPTLAVMVEHYCCDSMSWEYEQAEAERRAQSHTDRLGQTVLWQFDAWFIWLQFSQPRSPAMGLH